MPEYGVSTFIVIQYLKDLKDFLVSEGTVMIDHAKLEPVLSGSKNISEKSAGRPKFCYKEMELPIE